MGRVANGERDRRTLDLFDSPPIDGAGLLKPETFKALNSPVWTENKARVIQNYVRYFTYVTKHGTYLDAFAGPQVGRPTDDSWAAKLVLELQPPWLRRFVLCERNDAQFALLQGLVSERVRAGDSRKVSLVPGDCNSALMSELARCPIAPNEAAFCLLDQRTFECDWETVRGLAAHKASGNKIELFYFLAVGWLFRSKASVKNEAGLARWWGSDDIETLLQVRRSYDMAQLFVARFKSELGYRSVQPWPIRSRRNQGRIMFFMIHAADHEEAPRLMYRAYRRATGAPELMEHLQLEMDAAGFEREALGG